MRRDLSVVLDGFSFLESPRWREGRVWLSDFYTHRVIATDCGRTVETVAHVPGQPSGLGWLPDGRMLVVSMRDRRLLRREASGEMVQHADLCALLRGHLNDMVVDAQGRAYVGSFGFDLMAGAPVRPSGVVRVDPDGASQVVAEDLLFPNGSVILPDGTFVIAETVAQRLTAFEVDCRGELSGRRAWAAFGDPPTGDLAEVLSGLTTAPDGICADAEGAIWVSDALHGRLLRVREGGEVVDEIDTGEAGVFACMLGGEDRRTLFACVAPSFVERERRGTREARLLACRVRVPGAGLP